MSDLHAPQLGDTLRAERRKRRLSLRDVSYETGVSVNTLSRVERGYLPDLKNYQRLVEWLRVPADTFLETSRPESPGRNTRSGRAALPIRPEPDRRGR